MVKKRWGALSVKDHIDTAALAADVMLYDKLVIPTVSGGEGSDEWKRWKDKGWKPDLLQERLTKLGTIAVTEEWGTEWKRKFDERKTLYSEVSKNIKDGFMWTSWMLAEELKKGQDVTIIPAFRSVTALKEELIFDEEDYNDTNATLLLGQSLSVPADADPEIALDKAIELSKDSEFQEKRTNLYRWQEEKIREGMPAEEIVEDMDQLIQKYNKCVEDASEHWRRKVVFTLIGSVLGVLGGITNPLSIGGAVLTLVGLWTQDRRPVIHANQYEPAAIFHDVQGLWDQLVHRSIGRRILDRIRD